VSTPALAVPAVQSVVGDLLEMFDRSPAETEQIEHAARHIDRFYESRRSRNHRGEWIDVTNSPVLPDVGRMLLLLVVAEEATATLEVGFSFGMSASHILLGQRLLGGGRHLAIDPFQHSEHYQGCGLMNVAAAHLADGFRWLEQPSSQALPGLVRDGEQLDLCFIDGSHLLGDIFVDAYYCDQLLRPHGVMVFDDAWLPATRTVADIMVTNYGYQRIPTPEATNMFALRRPAAAQGDWKSFADAFVPFQVG
jgi:predicted O-methyltransferase YrrM